MTRHFQTKYQVNLGKHYNQAVHNVQMTAVAIADLVKEQLNYVENDKLIILYWYIFFVNKADLFSFKIITYLLTSEHNVCFITFFKAYHIYTNLQFKKGLNNKQVFHQCENY